MPSYTMFEDACARIALSLGMPNASRAPRPWEIARWMRTSMATVRQRELEEFVRTCRDGFDCDNDAHRYNTLCRACEARKLCPPTE